MSVSRFAFFSVLSKPILNKWFKAKAWNNILNNKFWYTSKLFIYTCNDFTQKVLQTYFLKQALS